MELDELRDLLRRDGFSALFDGHPDGIFAFTPEGRFVLGNPPMVARGGYSAEQLATMNFRDFLRSDDVELAVAEFEAAAQGERRQYLATGVRADGSVIKSQITHIPFVHNGQTVAVLGMAKDVGALESALASERQTQALLRTAGRVARFGGWYIDLATSERRWSDEIYAILGYPPDQAVPARDLLVRESSASGAELTEALAQCALHGVPFEVDTDVISAQGDTLRLRLTAEAVRDEAGAIIAVQGAALDITERESGRRAEARLAAVVGSISDSLIFVDGDWTITYLNRPAEQLLRVSEDDALGRGLWDLFPRAVATEFSIAFHRALEEGRTVNLRDFSSPLQRWIDATAYPTGSGLALYLRDVTESEQVRQDLFDRNAEVAAQGALLDKARDAIIVRDLDSTIRYWNASAAHIYGWDRDEVLGRKARDVLYAEPEQFDRALSATLREGQWSGELRQTDRQGASLDIESSWTLVRNESGEPTSIFSVNSDITERKRREERDLRMQRMESLGTLSSGIAHDLNNVLTPILMAVQLLTPGETDPGRRELLRSTEIAVKRGTDMIRQVLSFASGAKVRQIPVVVTEVLSELESLGADTLPADIRLRVEASPDLWMTSGDPTQLLQVLLNLVTNARDAITDGGTITVRAENITLADEYLSISHLALPGDYIQIEVEDDGGGMAPDVLTKIFEPFFTTKEVGSGTGLGLSTSIAIVQAHGGYMQAYSEPGRGSIFRIHLVAQREPVAADESYVDEPLDELPRGHGELILVVDDEAAIRMLTRQTLDAYGYATAVASNGSEAIAFIESGHSPVDLVLTDMAMPVMDGAATAAYILRNHPSIPVIAASGLNANGGVARAKGSGVRSFLAKPYTTAELLRALSNALRSAGDDATGTDT